jgi:Rieske Fe-S protein
MPEENSKEITDVSRRDFLGTVTSVAAGAGVVASCIPSISSMNPTADVLALASTEVDLKSISLAETKTVPWQGKPIFIMHRTPEEIAAMQVSNGGFDPEADKKRVVKPQWLVVIGICTHMGDLDGGRHFGRGAAGGRDHQPDQKIMKRAQAADAECRLSVTNKHTGQQHARWGDAAVVSAHRFVAVVCGD